MADNLSYQRRSWNMSRIKSKDTSIEVRVRSWLYHNGFRYFKNVRELSGKPDIVVRKYNTVIFIHGCFWHRHENCKISRIPKSRTDYWEAKFKKNIENDEKNIQNLRSSGWKVIVIWECEINSEQKLVDTMQRLKECILNRDDCN